MYSYMNQDYMFFSFFLEVDFELKIQLKRRYFNIETKWRTQKKFPWNAGTLIIRNNNKQ